MLLNLIDRLPQNSHYVEAQAQDDELAHKLAQLPELPSAGPRWSEWSPEREALAMVIDRLGDVITNMAVLNKAKPPRIRRQRRPDNAMRRIREDQRRARHEQLVLQLLPDKDTDAD